jgi:hypothetical protein
LRKMAKPLSPKASVSEETNHKTEAEPQQTVAQGYSLMRTVPRFFVKSSTEDLKA